MREPHPEIMAMLPNAYEGFQLSTYLEKQWPQFNPKSNIKYVYDTIVYSDDLLPYKPDASYPFFRKGRKAKLYRLIGDLLRRPKLWERGITRGISPYATVPIRRREVKLIALGMNVRYEFGRSAFNTLQGAEFRLYAGYDSCSDTLFVLRR